MSRINNYMMEQVAIVEKEFENMEYEILFDRVYDLVMGNEKYDTMSEVDKFDYLVDNIIEMEQV